MPDNEDSDVASTYDFASGLQPPASSSDGLRPVKRRRLSPDHEDDGSSLRSFISHGSDAGSGAADSDAECLPVNDERARHPRRDADKREKDEADPSDNDNNKPRGSRRKIYEPKYHTVQDPVFVTQLTQPPSSPSRIRGPRWQKPHPDFIHPAVPAPPSATPPSIPADGMDDGQQSNQPDCYHSDDDDTRAAIAASLESFQETEVNGPQNNNDGPSQEPDAPLSGSAADPGPAMAAEADTSFLDDIPDDAFDTSPDSSPNKRPANPMPPPLSHNPSGTSQQNDSNMRQTTLLGGFAQKPKSSSQGASHNWPLASQGSAESPTHHRLDPEALDCWVYPANLGERRDYQFNIAQRGLFHNLLVALPTGLGKTFIAATIMLNWFRWTTEGQIVFVAPTKPLVSQQVEACFGIVGIPRSQTTMLTGEAQPAVRQEEWESKRVFFMTPQTLINDLKSGIADPKKIVLLVIDEAHRATGSYAYTQVVHFLQRFNASFRVLALTATPGSTVESVQEVIDNLNISRVEIRTETSLDIREYVNMRNVEIETFDNSDEMAMVMQLFAKCLQPAVDQLRNLNAYWARDPMTLTPYGLTVARKQWMASAAAKNASWALKGKVNTIFTVLASLAHSIDLLKYHGIGPFYRSLLSFQDPASGGNNGKVARQITDDRNFKVLQDRLRAWTNDDEFVGHPKLEYLRNVVLNHFLDAQQNGADDDKPETRIMVFSHFRDSAEEIVRVLKKHAPIVKPHVFVGQANAKGSEGMDQKKQLQIVEKFKTGVYNTIVATSIGEEGLDIGEVDLIICYDSSASPIRMLQRMGRTGRKRQGNITLLLMKGKEEESYIKAKDNYVKMQDLIASGSRFRYHTDKSPRIIPREIQPIADERKIEIPVENSQADLPEPTRRPGRVPKKRPPKKFHMPDGVETGFTKASRVGRPQERPTADHDFHQDGSEPDVSYSLSRNHDELATVPRPHEISLTSSQKADLAAELRENTTAESPRVDAFPSTQRYLRPTRFVRHGCSTRGMVTALRQMAEMGSDCEDSCRKQLRTDDVARFMSSPDNSPAKPSFGSGFRGENHDREEEEGALLSDDRNSFSSLMCSPSPARRSNRRRPRRAQTDNHHDEDDSDIPGPSTFFDELQSINNNNNNQLQLSPPQEEPLEEDEHFAPQPSAPRNNRYVIVSSDDDSDSF